MVCKVCTQCQGKSYSAAAEGVWTCPYCKEDLTKVQAVDPQWESSDERGFITTCFDNLPKLGA